MFDNYTFYEMHEREIARQEKHLPKCCLCDEYIWQDAAVHIGGNWYCDECLEENREAVPDDEGEW